MTKTTALKMTGVFVAGAGIGACIALLNAPDKGVRTRRALKRYAIRKGVQLDELKDELLSSVDDFRHDVENSIASCVETTKGVVEDARRPVGRLLNRFRNGVPMGSGEARRPAGSVIG